MSGERILLWSDDEKPSGSGSANGTFQSCDPAIYAYPARQGQGRGTVIICPGGGYEMKAVHEGEPVAHWLNSLGLNAYVLDYRVFPDLHPAPLMDVRRAVLLARQRASENGDRPDKIAVLGFSAGGHLAASAGTMWAQIEYRPDALILCYPVISFGKSGHVGSRLHLLGENANSAMISDLSLENRVDRQTPPAFIWHTADDAVVPVENSLLFAQALASKQVSFSCHIFPSGEHGLGLADSQVAIRNWQNLCHQFLLDQGF